MASCSEGYYGRTSDRTCQLCNSNCKSCNTPDEPSKCLTCSEPNFLEGAQCVEKCPKGKYG